MTNATFATYNVSVMLLNFFSSVSIVWANKVASNNGFRWTTTLTAFHFLCTFLSLLVARKLGIIQMRFNFQKDNVLSLLPLCCAFVGFVVFNNLSLRFNSVGLYQLLKVMTAPCIVVFQYAVYGNPVPLKDCFALIPVCIGVAIATVTTVQGTQLGFFFGLLGVLSTSIYQIWIKRTQVKMDSTVMLFYQSIISCFLLAAIVPFAEPQFWDIFDYEWVTPKCGAAVLLSGLLAAFVNLSILLVIDATSPLTYNVLGHAKLCTCLASGYVLFHEPFEMRPFVGIALAVTGIVLYSKFRIDAAAATDKLKTNKSS
eukprot:GEMP01040285.1.p1 GENE.GEMP01040285.1~~GEMP01040285.1.p1  ORF type:complete len:313 (+),score=41.73 GEMP01040285.1:110-1048(+)